MPLPTANLPMVTLKQRRRIFLFALSSLVLFLPTAAYAVAGSDFVTALISLQRELEYVWIMLAGVSRLMGIWFVSLSVYKLKAYGRMTAFMSQNTSVLRPLAYLMIGAILWFLPDTLDLSMETLWGYGWGSEVKAYATIQGGDAWEEAITPIVVLLRVVGLGAFLRGWTLLARSTNEGAQPGQFGKGATHIIGGVLAMNAVGTVEILKNTFGY